MAEQKALPAPTRNLGGRPTKLTPEVQTVIVNAILAGNYMDVAAASAGVSKTTLMLWLRNGARAEGGIQKEFSHACEKALAEAEVRDVAMIARAGMTEWQAIAWRLERRHPDRWGRKERHEVTGAGGGPVQIQVVYDNPSLP